MPARQAESLARRSILTRPIKEMPAETDEQIGYEFRRLRVSSGLSANRLASTLGVSLNTLEALERGVLAAIPERPKAERLIAEYCRIARLDQRPLLVRLKAYSNTREVQRGQARWTRSRRRRHLLRGAGLLLLLAAATGTGVAIALWPEVVKGMTAPAFEAISGWAEDAIAHIKSLLASNAR